MTTRDVPAVVALADIVHPTFHEGEATFHDRIALFPQGCLVLSGPGGAIHGYAIAYPARLFDPPPLDVVLGALPEGADALYVHDVALSPQCRGRRLAEPAIDRLLALAEAFGAAMLVSVYGTPPFWRRFGFEAVDDPRLAGKLAPYGEDAVFMTRPGGKGSASPHASKTATT